jgi:hypothetical protein
MPEVRFTSIEDKQILLIDLSNITNFELFTQRVQSAIELGGTSPEPDSLRTLLDLTGTQINQIVIASLKNLSQTNGRYAKATAFVGLTGLWRIALKTMFRIRGKKNHCAFETRSDATQWLLTW